MHSINRRQLLGFTVLLEYTKHVICDNGLISSSQCTVFLLFFFKLKQPFQAAHLRVSEGEDMMGIWIYFRWKNSIKLSKFNASHKRLADLDHGSYRMIKSNLYS